MEKKHINPYLAGGLLGGVIILSVFLTGETLGASGAPHRLIIAFVAKFMPQYALNSVFYTDFFKGTIGSICALDNWIVYEALGIIFGAFLSGFISKRLKFAIDKGPQITTKRRLLFALLGGTFFGFGARLAHGCTSGGALSGMTLLSASGFVATVCIFGTGFLLAFFFRKNWI
jgi:hypothetical protein